MSGMIVDVKSAQVTQAVRDTILNGVEIHNGDWMGIIDGDIQIVADTSEAAAEQSVEKMLDDDSEIVTIIFGADTKEKAANKLAKSVSAIDEDLEIEIHDGGQPLYPFLISVE